MSVHDGSSDTTRSLDPEGCCIPGHKFVWSDEAVGWRGRCDGDEAADGDEADFMEPHGERRAKQARAGGNQG